MVDSEAPQKRDSAKLTSYALPPLFGTNPDQVLINVLTVQMGTGRKMSGYATNQALTPDRDKFDSIMLSFALAKSARTHARFLLEYSDEELIDLERQAQESSS